MRAQVQWVIVGAMLGGCGGARPLTVPTYGTSDAGAVPFAPFVPPSSGAAGDSVPPNPGGQGGAGAGDSSGVTMSGQAGAGGADPAGPSGSGAAGMTPPPDVTPVPLPIPVPSPPPPAFCDGMVKRPLPYAIARDFSSVVVLNAVGSLGLLSAPDCVRTVDSTCVAFHYGPDDCVLLNGATPGAGAADGGTADAAPPDPALATCWAGIIVAPNPFFGGPGICIAPGATAIHFKARASRDAARIKFGAIRAGLNETEFFLALSTTWQDYVVSLPAGEDYDNEVSIPQGGVWNGFSVVVEPQDHAGGTDIFVRDVVWSAN